MTLVEISLLELADETEQTLQDRLELLSPTTGEPVNEDDNDDAVLGIRLRYCLQYDPDEEQLQHWIEYPKSGLTRSTGSRHAFVQPTLDRYAPTTINHRLAAVTGLFALRTMRDPTTRNPVPKGREARHVTAAERTGLLGHLATRPKPRSALRLREPKRLPRGLDRRETTDLLGSLRTWRDRAIAGLMLFSGLRSCEVLALDVTDVDIGARWLRVTGKGAKERRVRLDVDVAGVIQTYLLAERPDTTSARLFVVAKGPHRSQPLTPAGLRTIFRYHRNPAEGCGNCSSGCRATDLCLMTDHNALSPKEEHHLLAKTST